MIFLTYLLYCPKCRDAFHPSILRADQGRLATLCVGLIFSLCSILTTLFLEFYSALMFSWILGMVADRFNPATTKWKFLAWCWFAFLPFLFTFILKMLPGGPNAVEAWVLDWAVEISTDHLEAEAGNAFLELPREAKQVVLCSAIKTRIWTKLGNLVNSSSPSPLLQQVSSELEQFASVAGYSATSIPAFIDTFEYVQGENGRTSFAPLFSQRTSCLTW